MVKINDILDAVAEALRDCFHDCDVYQNHIPQDFKRPCFFVAADGAPEQRPIASGILQKTLTVSVTAFAEVDDYYITQQRDLNSLTDGIYEAFASVPVLSVGDRCLKVWSVDVTENGLDYSETKLTLRWTEAREAQETAPLMEHININGSAVI